MRTFKSATAPCSYEQKCVANRLGFGESKPFTRIDDKGNRVNNWDMTMGEFQTKYEACLASKGTPKVDNRKPVLTGDNAVFANILSRELRSFKSEIKDFVRKEITRQLR